MSGSNGRGQHGRFAVGNCGGPGRPRREKERQLFSSIKAAVTAEDWLNVTQRAVEDAKAGDARARDWLSRLLLPNSDEAAAWEDELNDSELDRHLVKARRMSVEDLQKIVELSDEVKAVYAKYNDADESALRK